MALKDALPHASHVTPEQIMAGTYCEPERIELAGFVEQCVEATMSTLAILHGHPGSLPYGTLQKLREAFKEAADNFEAVDPGTLPAH